jgi:putative ABC transport system permease protein
MFKQDLRDAWRGLRRTPIITFTAVLTLALGVGASTAVFSVVHAVLLRPLPYPEPGRLVELFEDNLTTGSPMMRVSALNYLSWAERARYFDAIAAVGSAGFTVTDGGDPELVSGSVVSASLFHVLGVPPIVGRTMQQDDEHRASPRVVVLSESLWRRRFGGDPHMVGRSIALDGEPHQVVGVMPRAFREVGRSQIGATGAAQIFVPMRIDRTRENRGNRTLRVVARLRPGVPLNQARDEMRGLAAAMEQEFPATNASWSVRIDRLTDTMLDPQVERSLRLLFSAVAVVLLIACANVANLLLARGTRRYAELSVRAALGAGRGRLVGQLLTESACLALISGAVGVVTAVTAQPLVRALMPAGVPRLDEMRVDASVLAFGLVVSFVSGLVFGVVPALRASRVDLSRSLTSAGRGSMHSSGARLRRTLIVGQTALATMLLVSAALLVQGFVRLQRVALGFEPANVLTTRVSLPRSAYPDAARAVQFYDGLLTALRGSGELQVVAIATSAPFAPGVRASFRPPETGRASAAGIGSQVAAEHIVSGDYFRVLGIPVLAGRSFDERDSSESAGVAVVSRRMARLFWPDADPIGQTLERAGRTHEVVGVVGDVRGSDVQGLRGGGPDREARAAVYFAASQLPQRTMTLLVRPTGEPTSVINTIRNAVRQLDPRLALQQTRPLRDWHADSLAPTRLTTTLAAVFATSALLLTSIGIYGVLAYTVASRTREIGVRIAMGATARSVTGLVLRDGMTWAGGGILIGLAGALAAARLLATLVFEVTARDPITFATVGSAVALVALIACAVPAARAVRIDPTMAMRSE